MVYFGTVAAGSETRQVLIEAAKLEPGARIWPRFLALFLALAAMKVALLAGMGKHLLEVHWRVGESSAAWCPPLVAFYVFVILGVLNVVRLARHCQSLGVGSVQAANGIVLCLGLLFVFLTFHTGENNYLYPIMTRVLHWTSLGPYLSLDCFFRPPFLAAWLFGYAFIYYILVRTGRESWALHLTAVFGGVYAVCCLRELPAYRNELLLADGLGLLSLALPELSRGKRQWLWLAVPAIWGAGFAWGLFKLASPHEGVGINYFYLLLGSSVVLFAGATMLAQRRGFLGPWVSQVIFYFVSFLLLTNNHYAMAENYNNALCLGLEFPHYLIGELLLATVVAVCAALHARIWPRASLWWLDLLCLVLIAATLLDLRLWRIMGVRLDWELLSFGNSPRMMWRMSKPYLAGALAAMGLVAVVYYLAVRGIQHWLSRRQAEGGAVRPGWGGWYALGSLAMLGVLGWLLSNPDRAEGQATVRLVQTSPLWSRVQSSRPSPDAFLRSARNLGIGNLQDSGRVVAASPRRDLNVLLVLLESSYNQHLSLFGSSELTQPLLSKYRDRMELFPNFFSTFAGSIHARFATFTGLYPVRDFNAFTLRRVNVKSLFEVFHDSGYASSLFYSSYLDYTGFRDFLSNRGMDQVYDADSMPGKRGAEHVSWGVKEEETLGAIRSQIKQYASGNQRFLLTYVPAAPHYPYDCVPEAFRQFKSSSVGDFKPLYLNELLYMDWVVASILDQLKESGLLDKTLVVITDDHGEMLGEQGGRIGHGWVVTPELANAPLIIMDPQKPGYRLNHTVGSQIDLLPTLLDLLGMPIPANQLYEGRSLYTPEAAEQRLVYLNSYEGYGVIVGKRFIAGNRKSGGKGSDHGADAVYSISNQESKTIFTKETTVGIEPVSIGAFDEFQENLLRNYTYYSQALGNMQQAGWLRNSP